MSIVTTLENKKTVAVSLRLFQKWCGYFAEIAVIVVDKRRKKNKMKESFLSGNAYISSVIPYFSTRLSE